MTTARPARRFSVKKGIVLPIGVMATTVASLAVMIPAQADTHASAPCAP